MDSEVQLKTNGVIEELWPTEVRTKRSADVATEMNRLRRALESYYESEGMSDPITIYLPNRSASTGEGADETRWVAAKVRPASDSNSTAAPEASRVARSGGRRMIGIALATAALVVLAIAGYFLFRVLVVHPRPQFGRMDGTVLRIFDASGKELWSKNFPEGFGPDWYYDDKLWGPHIWFADLDGKGHTSVLFSYSPPGTE